MLKQTPVLKRILLYDMKHVLVVCSVNYNVLRFPIATGASIKRMVMW